MPVFASVRGPLEVPALTACYGRIFRWHVLRYLARHPLLASLNVLTVALGVALYLAIQLANLSANRAFEASVDVVAGRAQLEVNAPAGDFRNSSCPRLRCSVRSSGATPIIEDS